MFKTVTCPIMKFVKSLKRKQNTYLMIQITLIFFTFSLYVQFPHGTPFNQLPPTLGTLLYCF